MFQKKHVLFSQLLESLGIVDIHLEFPSVYAFDILWLTKITSWKYSMCPGKTSILVRNSGIFDSQMDFKVKCWALGHITWICDSSMRGRKSSKHILPIFLVCSDDLPWVQFVKSNQKKQRNNIETRLFLSKNVAGVRDAPGTYRFLSRLGGFTCNYIPTETG